MKAKLLCSNAVIALISGLAPMHAASAMQTPDAPAGTVYMPTPTLEEEFVYLRDVIAQQALRLDQTEQMLSKQSDVINAQSQKIAALEAMLSGLRETGNAPPLRSGEELYTVRQGDTLTSIAARMGTSVAALAAANDLEPPYPIAAGQTLARPRQAEAMRVAAAPAPAPAPAKTDNAASSAVPSAASPSAPPAARVADAGATAPERADSASAPGDDNRRPQEEGVVEVGVRPEDEDERPYLSLFTDVGGILTPRGSLFVEPAVEYTVSSDNRFFFQGIEIVDAVLIGLIEATDSDRRAVTESLTLRYGLTNRLEIDGRVSYISRDDRISGVSIDNSTASFRDLDGNGFGDAEIGLHYQLNRGRRFPYAIANLRAKAPTGRGPFDVRRDQSGLESELATGSGFWTIEPSMTFILSSDPAVLFGNVGYQANLSASPNEMIGTAVVREFRPGDAIRTSLGLGLSLNERLSVNFAYDQSYFFESETIADLIQDGASVTTVSTQPATTVGSFLFGGSYAVTDRLRINFNSALGATDEAPDARVTLRAQYRLFD